MKGLALFLLVFLILYGGLHAYAFFKVRRPFRSRRRSMSA